MSKLISALTGVVLATSFALPVTAAPISAPQPAQVQTDAVEQINHRRNGETTTGTGDTLGGRAVTTAGVTRAMTTAGATATVATTATTADQTSIST